MKPAERYPDLPKQTAKQTLKALNNLKHEIVSPFKVLAVLQ
jgi:hypothetical protein